MDKAVTCVHHAVPPDMLLYCPLLWSGTALAFVKPVPTSQTAVADHRNVYVGDSQPTGRSDTDVKTHAPDLYTVQKRGEFLARARGFSVFRPS